MLTEKDYCDYDTWSALKELGCDIPRRLIPDYLGVLHEPQFEETLHIYDAQKWLRENHNLHISTKPYPNEGGLMWMFEIRKFSPYLVSVIVNKTGFYDSEEALLEGIKEAIKILKEDQ